MLNPAIGKLLEANDSKYSIVIAVAKRARQISQEAENAEEALVEKPVNAAIRDLSEGRFKIV